MPSKNPPTSFRLSTQALAILDALSTQLGISRAAVVELALRRFRKQNG